MKIKILLPYQLLLVGIIAFNFVGCEQDHGIVPENSAAETTQQSATFKSGILGFPPVISGFTPLRGIPGTHITIFGSWFSGTPAFNTVTIDGVPATVVSSSFSKIIIVVPAGASSGKISVVVSGFQTLSNASFQVIDLPLDGLVVFYPFDGNAKDVSSNQLHGLVTGATLSTDRNGSAQSSYYFDGNDYINMGNPAQLQIVNEITLSVWIRLNTTITAMRDIITKRDPNALKGFNFIKDITALGVHRGGFKTWPKSSPTCMSYLSGQIIPYEWICMTVTLTGSEMKFYMNGVLVNQATNHCQLIDTSNGNFLIGTGSMAYLPFLGDIDDVAVYKRAIRAEEVMQLYQQNILH
jgi:hypothetical protein